MFKQPAQAAVLVPLRIRVAGRHIRCKEHIAQQGIDCGKGALLLCRQLAVFLPEEEHIRVAAVGATIELTPEHRVVQRLLCGHPLPVEQAHIPHIVPVQAHVATDTAVIHQPEGRHHRHAAAEDGFLSAPTTQQLHGTAHPGGTTLVGVAKGGSAIQKIQLDKVEAPVVQHPVEHPAQIFQHGRVVDIQRIKAAPVAAAAPRFAVRFQQPVRVLKEKGRVLFAHKGCKP